MLLVVLSVGRYRDWLWHGPDLDLELPPPPMKFEVFFAWNLAIPALGQLQPAAGPMQLAYVLADLRQITLDGFQLPPPLGPQ